MASLFSCSLPEAMANDLRQLKEEQKVSINSLIREGIELVLEKYKQA